MITKTYRNARSTNTYSGQAPNSPMEQAVRLWTVLIGHGAETFHEIITYDYVFSSARGLRARGHQALVVRVPEPHKSF